MSNFLSDRFIVIKTYPYKESDLIIKAISSHQGLKRFLARGALNSKKRFGGGVLEPFHYLEFTFDQGKKKSASGESVLIELKEAKLLEDFKAIRKSYQLVSLGLKILSCYDHLELPEAECRGLFYLLGHSLRALGQTSDLDLFEVQFIAKFLYDQGVLDVQGDSDWVTYIEARFNTLDINRAQVKKDKLQLEKQMQQYLNLPPL